MSSAAKQMTNVHVGGVMGGWRGWWGLGRGFGGGGVRTYIQKANAGCSETPQLDLVQQLCCGALKCRRERESVCVCVCVCVCV